MILHHYIWGTDDVQIVDEMPPHFLIVKSSIGNGNLALFSKLSERQSYYFRNANKRFYDAGFNENGESMDPSDDTSRLYRILCSTRKAMDIYS